MQAVAARAAVAHAEELKKRQAMAARAARAHAEEKFRLWLPGQQFSWRGKLWLPGQQWSGCWQGQPLPWSLWWSLSLQMTWLSEAGLPPRQKSRPPTKSSQSKHAVPKCASVWMEHKWSETQRTCYVHTCEGLMSWQPIARNMQKARSSDNDAKCYTMPTLIVSQEHTFPQMIL
eukprot:6272979-Amphidinium_carterae.1